MSTYATLDALKGYTSLVDGHDDAELQNVLDQAERDINAALVEPVDGRQVSGLKYDPAALEHDWLPDALSRATCAQAEYRLTMGAEFFVRAQHDRVRSPDFTTEGQLPYLGPKVARELDGTGLLQLPGMASVSVARYTRLGEPRL